MRNMTVGIVAVQVLLVIRIALSAESTTPSAVLTPTRPSTLLALAFSPDGKLLAAGGVNGDLDVWDHRKRQHIAHFKAHRAAIQAIRFTDKNDVIVTGSTDGTFAFWNIREKKLIHRVTTGRPGDNIIQLCVDSKGDTVFTTNQMGVISKRDAPYEKAQKLPYKGTSDSIVSMDGTRLLTRDATGLVEINLSTGQQRPLMQSMRSAKLAFTASPGLQTVALAPKRLNTSIKQETLVHIFRKDGEKTTCPFALTLLHDMALSPDGKVLSLCGSDSIAASKTTSNQLINVSDTFDIPLVHLERGQHAFTPRARGHCYATAVSTFPYDVAYAGASGQVRVYRIPFAYVSPPKN